MLIGAALMLAGFVPMRARLLAQSL